MITQGSKDHPVQLDPFQLIKEVHWRSGGIGVLSIDFPGSVSSEVIWLAAPDRADSLYAGGLDDPIPEGLAINISSSFGVVDFFPSGTFTKDDLPGEISRINNDFTIGSDLYEHAKYFWVIEAFSFPNNTDPDSPGYWPTFQSIYTGSGPYIRLEEPADLRFLGTDVASNRFADYPQKGEWLIWDYGFYPDGTPGYEADLQPFTPNTWGLGEHQDVQNINRVQQRRFWILNFGKDKIPRDSSLLLVNDSPKSDPYLGGGFTMKIEYKTYPENSTFSIVGDQIVSDKPAAFSGTKSVSYLTSGTIATIKSNSLS